MLSRVPVMQDSFVPIRDESPQLRLPSSFTAWFCVRCIEQLPRGPNQKRTQAHHGHKVPPKAPYNR